MVDLSGASARVHLDKPKPNLERVKIMSRMDKLIMYKTTLEIDGDKGCVTYTDTDIVKWVKNKIILCSGGWKSVTTKRKMNQASNQFNLGYSVFQKDFVWYVDTPQGETVKYYDGITLEMKG